MFSILVWKEWKQIRVLTLVGAALGLFLPLALYLFAADRSTHRFFRAYTTRDVFVTLCPMLLAFGVWPLWALMSSVQAFSADRGAGTERFLLDRPVSRTRVWLSRLLTSLGSLLAVIGASLTGWVLFGALLGGLSLSEMTLWSGEDAVLPYLAGLLVLLFAAGVLAASLGGKSFAGVLLGGALAGIFAALVGKLAAVYFFIGGLVLGWGEVLLPLLFLGVSWLMLCRGEPAGRGRLKRGIAALLAASLALGLVLLLSAPSLIRWTLREVSPQSTFVIGGDECGETTVLRSSKADLAAWLLDPRSGKRLRFFPPAVTGIAFSKTGRRLALATNPALLDSHEDQWRIEFYDSQGSPLGKAAPIIAAGRGSFVQNMFWHEGKVLFVLQAEHPTGGLYEADPDTGAVRRILSLPGKRFALIHGRESSRVFLVREVAQEEQATAKPAGEDNQGVARYERGNIGLFEVDLAAGTISPEPRLLSGGSFWGSSKRIAPSGRYWVDAPAGRAFQPSAVVEIDSGKAYELADQLSFWQSCWLPGDRLVWIGHANASQEGTTPPDSAGRKLSLNLWRPGGTLEVIRSWEPHSRSFTLLPEPRGERLMMIARSEGGTPARLRIDSLEVYDPAAGTWQRLPVTHDERPVSYASWAASGALTLEFGSQTYLLDLARPGLLIPL